METEPVRVLGLDPSLTSFGLAVTSGPGLTPMLYRVKPKLRGHERLHYLLSEVGRLSEGADLAVIEGLAYGAQGNSLLELAALQWMVRHALWGLGVRYALVSPAQVKQFATGHGDADKAEVAFAVGKWFPGSSEWARFGADKADALWLAAMGAQWLGQPVVQLPAKQRDIVHANWDGKQKGHKRGDPKIVWPDLGKPWGATPPEQVVDAEIVDDEIPGQLTLA